MAARGLRARNETRGATLATAAWRAANPWTRTVGLLGRAGLAPGEALHIIPCRSVHTLFMRFTIDLLYLDREGRVVKAAPGLRPFRYSWGGRRAHSVLELPAGVIASTATAPADTITVA